MKTLKLLLFISIAAVVIWFSVLNFDKAEISLYPFPWVIYLPIYIIGLLGTFIGICFGMIGIIQTKITYKRKLNKIKLEFKKFKMGSSQNIDDFKKKSKYLINNQTD